MNLFRRLACWLTRHRWLTDLQLFATNLPCPARCARCGKRVVFNGTWGQNTT